MSDERTHFSQVPLGSFHTREGASERLWAPQSFIRAATFYLLLKVSLCLKTETDRLKYVFVGPCPRVPVLTEAGVKSPRSWRYSVYEPLVEDARAQTLVLFKISCALNY